MKEQTAPPRALAVERPVPATLQRVLVPTLFVALALLVASGYGSGIQLNDGQAGLHINPLEFLGRLLHAWNPLLAMGTHTGFWVPYQMPYSWVYGVAQVLHVPQDFAQHAAVFFVYLGCLWSMYYCLRSVAPWLDEIARIAGSCAYLFNMYVALNSQAQIVWLLTYGVLPAMIGVTARAIRGEVNLWRASLAIALLVLLGGGVNPPLVAINVVVLAIFIVITVAFDPKPSAALNRTVPVIAAAAVATVAINLYWLVPFVDYFRGVWLNGVLSEAPSMHNAATSFANVLRGLGHWATFVSFAGRAYFPWAAAYASGLFGALLWFVPIVAFGGVAFRRNQRPATLFFLIVTLVSVPIVVGYYHDALGDAVTTPLYDQFYRNFPGFQMFRFSYKWVAGVEFGISGLYALGAFAMITALRDYIGKFAEPERRNRAWLVSAARTAAIALPILIFVPVLVAKMNYPGQSLPSWEFRESALVGSDQRQRVALFPTQFLEQFDWGNPQFYIEDSLVNRPLIYGLLGSEPSEGTDMWIRRAYRATREGLPLSADMFRAMGVNTILQRDDFIPVIDFSSPGEWRFNSATLTHDLLQRVIRAAPVRADGPLRVYSLSDALPLIYGVTHPVISTLPTFTDAYLGDLGAMAKGRAQFDPPTRSADEFSSAMQSLSPILPGSAEQVRDLAVNESLAQGVRVHPPSADAAWMTHFVVKASGIYSIFALDQSFLFARAAPQTIVVDGKYLSVTTSGGTWTGYGSIPLTAGKHWVSDGYLDPDLVVAIVGSDDLRAWQNRIVALTRALPKNLSIASQVYAQAARIEVPVSGRYRIRATAVAPFGPDGLAHTDVRRVNTGGGFPGELGSSLAYFFGSGAVATSELLMPAQWFRDDPTVYQWQRGDPISWFLLSRHSTMRVFVPGNAAVRARVSMRISRLQVSDLMTVRVAGEPAQSISLPGESAAAQAYDTIDRLDGPTPVDLHFPLDLQPGWNQVAFDFHPTGDERADLGQDVISAAVAPDLAFERIGTAPARRAALRPLTVFAIGHPHSALTGDPEIIGSVAGAGDLGASLAVALAHNGRVVYRLFPLARDGSFDVHFLHAFPNDWNDVSQRVAGIWLVSAARRAKVSGVYYSLHALPGANLKHPGSLEDLPLSVDGRTVGRAPVALSRGYHRIASADPQLKIGLLTLEPLTLPRTRDVGLVWQRRSPTAINVTARSSATPFLLVFNEAFHPEWRATLDGVVLPHVIVNGVGNGWIVPALPSGGTIVMTFAGQAYYVIAGAISAIALLIMIVLVWAPDLWPIEPGSQ